MMNTVDAAPEWIGAISSAVGAAGTAGALIYAARTYGRQIEDARRDQANRISAYQVRVSEDRYAIAVSNTSGRSVYDCKVQAIDPLLDDIGMVNANGTLQWAAGGFVVLPPNETALVFNKPGDKLVAAGDHLLVVLAFRDQAGRCWRRDEHGHLTQISAEDLAEMQPQITGNPDLPTPELKPR
ncbi:MAG: hypothetical protein QOD39_5101 [Mycobacterium sp.]|jgi:hypothetical protein|nr:hypothetical protein [Mycobacterium sp.]